MLENIIPLTRKPDILDCLANLSSDEVFTPPDIANKVLDMLPQEVWSNPKLKFLDPCAKSGVFLREIAKRLMTGLEAVIPDEEQRRDHVFKNMVYGIAITELTALISRRSLYYSKDATNEHSVVEMDDVDGNIHYQRTEHTYKNKKCIHCGITEGSLDRGEERENYAYAFIHRPLKEVFNMKFDVIIGNPPYQLEDGGNKASASPLYQKFVEQAKELQPSYMSFIIPARWYAGGKGLDSFRNDMLQDKHISHLVDFPNAGDCFPGVEIKGGICYFLWNKHHNGPAEITNIRGGQIETQVNRYIGAYDVFVRANEAVPILEKVKAKGEPNIARHMSSRKPFGLPTNFTNYHATMKSNEDVKLYAFQAEGYVNQVSIMNNKPWINKYKVLLSSAYNGGDNYPHQIMGKPFLAEKGTACTETYMVCGVFDTKDEAELLMNYMKTRFFRFLLWLRKVSQHNPKDRFEFIPDIFSQQLWTDEDLYARYNLTDDEITFIQETVREMV